MTTIINIKCYYTALPLLMDLNTESIKPNIVFDRSRIDFKIGL